MPGNATDLYSCVCRFANRTWEALGKVRIDLLEASFMGDRVGRFLPDTMTIFFLLAVSEVGEGAVAAAMVCGCAGCFCKCSETLLLLLTVKEDQVPSKFTSKLGCVYSGSLKKACGVIVNIIFIPPPSSTNTDRAL